MGLETLTNQEIPLERIRVSNYFHKSRSRIKFSNAGGHSLHLIRRYYSSL